MPKKDFKEYICRPYCMFFKDGQKEKMACQAAQVVDALVHNGRIETVNIQSVVKDSRLWATHKETLQMYVCHHCPFRPEDCDFQSATPSEDLEPCGGFIVLAFLKEYGLIDEHAMEAVQ